MVLGIDRDITERVRAKKTLELRAHELRTLYQTSLEVNAQVDLDSLLRAIVQRAASLVGVETGGLYLMQPDGHSLKLVVAHNLPDHLIGITISLGEGLSGKVAQNGKVMVIEDYRVWKARLRIFNDTTLLRVLGVPLKAKDKVIGVINVADRTRTGSFSEEEIRLVSLFADQAALAIENARLFEQERARARELSTLYEATKTINSALAQESVLEAVAEKMAQIISSDGCTLSLLNRERDALVTLIDYRIEYPDCAESKGVIYYLSKYPASRRVLESGQPLMVNLKDKEADRSELAYMTERGIKSLLMLPLLAHDQVIGLAEVYEEEEERVYKQEEIQLLQSLAAQAAISLENARLFGDAQHRLMQTLALREIDKAIAGSMDLQVVLQVVLKHVIVELGVDAAVVLLYDMDDQTLKYALGSGLWTSALQYTRLRLGEGYAGRAALGRQTVHIPNLQTRTTDFLRSPTFSQEGFVCYFGVPLIAKDEIKGVLEIFHRAPLDPDTGWLDFMEALAGQVAIAIDNATLYRDLQRSNMELTMAYDATIEGWSRALDLRDEETEGHTQRVTKLTIRMAQVMDVSEDELVHIRRGALLHDIGKMGIPDRILLKPDKLTDNEWEIMRKHPIFAYEMLSPIEFLLPALDIPYCHHEKWDGSGYPRKLKGEEIPLVARIFAVVDVWDALTSNRPYRSAWTKEQALEYIREQSGKHFDPRVVEIFLRLIAE